MKPLRIGIVANELSGDQLGAGLIRAIRARHPEAGFEGVAGPRMLEAGCHSLVPMERLSVMGLVEVLKHLPELLAIRRRLARHFLDRPPDLFVGVDAPDFNLGLEARLRRSGIPTAHYVCPTVWAWRSGRVETLRRSADLVLSIFPFEQAFLERHRVPVRYVGHTLAEQIPLEPDRAGARRRLGLAAEGELVALLPGSRRSEVKALSRPFIEAALWCLERRPGLRFVAPLVNPPLRTLFEGCLQRTAPDLPITLVDGNSHAVLAASNLVLTASGTATLEGLLHKRPMVVGYRMNPLTYRILSHFKLVEVEHVAMANLLAGEALAPELIQDDCNGEALGWALLGFLEDPTHMIQVSETYTRIHREMRRDSNRQAADAVLGLLERGQPND